jgi:glycerol-3-phosphate acyltransferase PlsX
VALKISEGMVETVRFLLKQSLQATISSQVGFLLSRKAFADFKKRLDYSEYGGAPLLGLKGACIVSHGSSNSNAIKNAVRVAMEFANSQLNSEIQERIAAAGKNLNNHVTDTTAAAGPVGSSLV